MAPLVAQEAGDAPEGAQGFDGAGKLGEIRGEIRDRHPFLFSRSTLNSLKIAIIE